MPDSIPHIWIARLGRVRAGDGQGPSFEGIGARLSREWMAEWIVNPKSQRPSARMPRMFQANAEEQAEAAAAFLSSLQTCSYGLGL